MQYFKDTRTVRMFVTSSWTSLERHVTSLMSYCAGYIITSAISHSRRLHMMQQTHRCIKKAAGVEIQDEIVQRIGGSQTCNAAPPGFPHVQVSHICKISEMDQKYIT